MGMSASQARLLTITSRMHDVEYMAQSIQNAKIELSTQQDQVYQDYINALDATTFTVKNTDNETVVATFNSLCGINSVNVGNYRYALKDSKGRLIVDKDIADGYKDFKSAGAEENPYSFAIFMLSGQDDAKLNVYDPNDPDSFYQNLVKKQNYIGENYYKNNKDTMDKAWANLCEILGYPASADRSIVNDIDHDNKEQEKAYQDFINSEDTYLYNIYRGYAEEICESEEVGLKNLYDSSDFEYYADMYRQIEANGGSCVAFEEIGAFDGIEGIGNAANDSDWLKKQVESGNITIDIATVNKFGKAEFKSTSVPSDTRLEYTQTSTMDKSKLAKVEAKYEHDMKIINQKDKKFDMDLNKLETERSALKTEYDSVKKVIEDNVERTFGIFS